MVSVAGSIFLLKKFSRFLPGKFSNCSVLLSSEFDRYFYLLRIWYVGLHGEVVLVAERPDVALSQARQVVVVVGIAVDGVGIGIHHYPLHPEPVNEVVAALQTGVTA